MVWLNQMDSYLAGNTRLATERSKDLSDIELKERIKTYYERNRGRRVSPLEHFLPPTSEFFQFLGAVRVLRERHNQRYVNRVLGIKTRKSALGLIAKHNLWKLGRFLKPSEKEVGIMMTYEIAANYGVAMFLTNNRFWEPSPGIGLAITFSPQILTYLGARVRDLFGRR